MNAPVLVINCGSSSIKYALIDPAPDAPRLAGLAERLGSADARLKGINSAGGSFSHALPNADHTQALNAILNSLEERIPGAIGHRIVHGGEKFTQAALIDSDVISAIKATAALAPLHNPANLAGISATQKIFPALPQVAVFDTAFHQTLP
ncbi:MAG: acetate kinase, partial [Halomonas sp.]